MNNPTMDPYLAAVIQATQPADNALRTGAIAAIDGGAVKVMVNSGVVDAGHLSSYVPILGETVALMRQGADWLVLGSIQGPAQPTATPTAAQWNLASLQNGWTHRPSGPSLYYALTPTTNHVTLSGQIVPGTLTDGTVVTVLPPGFRPSGERIISARKGAGTRAILAINSNGNVSIFDGAGTTLVQLIETCIPLVVP